VRLRGLVAAAFLVTAWAAAPPSPVAAQGMLLVPAPEAGAIPAAVQMRDAQVIVEVGAEQTTTHVQVRFDGHPSELAWLLPVPAALVEVEASDPLLFAILEAATQPVVTVHHELLCPSPAYVCQHHPPADCSGTSPDDGDATTVEPDAGMVNTPEPVFDVVRREVAGAYDVAVLMAEGASEVVQWLEDEGFFVPGAVGERLQPYLDAGLLMMVARVVPTTGADTLMPLRMTYASSAVTLPLRLTALTAGPEMVVTAYVMDDGPVGQAGAAGATIDPRAVTTGRNRRVSYPMLLARTVDEAGGAGFVTEFAGPVPTASGVGGDDAELLGAAERLEELASEHTFLTRLTTRLSPHEVANDPAFGPVANAPLEGRATFEGARFSVLACRDDVLSFVDAAHIRAIMPCAAAYCGAGKCVTTDSDDAGCECEPGHVAREMVDMDGRASVTCVPAVGTAAVGPTGACAAVDCGLGTCVEVGGFAACLCDDGAAAEPSGAGRPRCVPVQVRSGSAGAENFSIRLLDVPVCAPAPPIDCGGNGWLVPNPDRPIRGLECATTPEPDPALLYERPPPSCPSGCSAAGPGGGHRHGWLALCGLLTALLIGAGRRTGGRAQL
jgi:hypothetical protein